MFDDIMEKYNFFVSTDLIRIGVWHFRNRDFVCFQIKWKTNVTRDTFRCPLCLTCVIQTWLNVFLRAKSEFGILQGISVIEHKFIRCFVLRLLFEFNSINTNEVVNRTEQKRTSLTSGSYNKNPDKLNLSFCYSYLSLYTTVLREFSSSGQFRDFGANIHKYEEIPNVHPYNLLLKWHYTLLEYENKYIFISSSWWRVLKWKVFVCQSGNVQ